MTDLVQTARPTGAGKTDIGKIAASAGLAVVLWASAFVAIRGIGNALSPAPLALLRLGVAAVTLTVI
ncbi:EamA family transporter, partial [Streptomyces broussonetiae]